MPYIYRYIDIYKEEVVYIGRATGYDDIGVNKLRNRDKQHHSTDQWCKDPNIRLQYIKTKTNLDADIVETLLINHYSCDQLYNIDKAWQEESKIFNLHDLGLIWKPSDLINDMKTKGFKDLFIAECEALWENTEGLTENLPDELRKFMNSVTEYSNDMQSEYKRKENENEM